MHDQALVRIELTWLQENVIEQAYLTDVMKRDTTLQHLDEIAVDLTRETGRSSRLFREATALEAYGPLRRRPAALLRGARGLY